MKYNLYLDDYRDPIDTAYYKDNVIYEKLKWEVVRNYKEFVEKIQKCGIPENISFDHDLADNHYDKSNQSGIINYDQLKEKTGYDCAKWLIYYCIENDYTLPNGIFIHSMNPVGSKNIKSLFDTYFKSMK